MLPIYGILNFELLIVSQVVYYIADNIEIKSNLDVNKIDRNIIMV